MAEAGQFSLRPARREDAAAMARLHALGFADAWSVTDFQDWLSKPMAFAIIVVDERDCEVGFGLALEAGDDAEILTIVTQPDMRGYGLGLDVIHRLNAIAAARGMTRWVLEVAEDNKSARRLYEKCGFAPIGRRKAYYAGPAGRVDAIVMAVNVVTLTA